MNHMIRIATLAMVCGLALPAFAAPTITALGSGTPLKVSNSAGGTILIGGGGIGNVLNAGRWSLTGNTLSATIAGGTGGGYMSEDGAYLTGIFLNNGISFPIIRGNTATGVNPAFSLDPTLVASTTQPANTEGFGTRWTAANNTWRSMGGLPGGLNGTSPLDIAARTLLTYGSGSNGGSSGNFMTPNAISADGRYTVGLGYISSYSNSSGTTISDNTFQWRAWIWDADANGGLGSMTVLPTPNRTSSNTWRKRTGNAYAVSADGSLVVGATDHNVGTSAAADPDGGRLATWRRTPGTDTWTMSYLPAAVDATGLVQTTSSSPGTVHMNAAGTIIVGRSFTTDGTNFIAKWVWNPVTSTWNNPINIGSNLTTPASWLPGSVTSCAIPPTLTPTGMSADGNVIVGSVTYSTCGSFMTGGFIWANTDDGIVDWYDYNTAIGTPSNFESYGPTGDPSNPSDPTKGLCKGGNPTGISPDGNIVIGAQGGTQRIINAPNWVLQRTGGTATCVPAAISVNPAATAIFARCSAFPTQTSVSLNVTASGTLPVTYQWKKDGVALTDGPSANGSTFSGVNNFNFRITAPSPLDAGLYTCTVTGCDGASVTSTASAVSADATYPAVSNQSPATALPALLGATNFNACAAYLNDGFAACTPTGVDFAPVWYRFVPTFTGTVRIQTCASTFDTTLAAYTTELNLIQCNNDVGSRGIVGTTCSSTRSLLTRIEVTEGTPILIRVSAASTATSTGVLTIIQNPAATPANDLCDNAQVVGIGSYPFNLSEATDDLTLGTDGCSGSGSSTSNRDIWFRINAPLGGTVTIDTCGSTMTNPMLHVYGECGGTVIVCNDNRVGTVPNCTSQQARIPDLVLTGSVLVRVSASGSSAPASGMGTLNITGTIFAPCSPADIVGAGGASDLPPGDGVLDGSDFIAFINAFSAGDLLADINHDLIVDGDDFVAFINAFGAGC